MISIRGLLFAFSSIHLATSSSEAPVATNALNSSESISPKLKKKLSSGQLKWYSPAVPAGVARHLSRVRPAITYPASVSRGLRGKSLERSFARIFNLFVSISYRPKSKFRCRQGEIPESFGCGAAGHPAFVIIVLVLVLGLWFGT